MLNWLTSVFDTQGFPARWDCGPAWRAEPFWGWLHIVSDLATFAAYTAIPIVFVYFLRKRPDLPVPKLWWLFATFIFACGTVHLLEAIIFWVPIYRLSGVIKFVTAIASWATVLVLLSAVPIALTFRSPGELERLVKERTTELRQASRRIKQNDERLQLALVAGRMGTWDWDLRDNSIQLDAGEAELTGLGKAPRTVTPEQFLERVHRGDRETSEKAFRQSIEKGAPYHHVFRMYVPEKGYRWLQGRGLVTKDAQGRAERLVGVHFDITEQMADQEALRVRTRAVEFATNSILIADARAEDQPIVYANAAFEELTGYRRKDILGKNCRILQGPETDPSVTAKLREAIRSCQECQVTILNYRQDGTSFWNNLHIAPVENELGVVTHFVGVQTDITARIEYEQRLIDAQVAAESANRAKSEFLANMSHEIRTPLTAILGCADSLCQDLVGETTRETAKTIRSQGQLLLGVLNDILDLSKIEAGKLEIHREECSLLAAVGEVRSLMEAQATEKGLDLVTDFQSPLPETIQTDPLRFRQILLNLTSNAIKFTDQGRVAISVRWEQQGEDSHVIVAVTDTGVGIPKERLGAIFDAFTQVDGSIARRVGGTGLGLTICLRLVRMLDGELNVRSEPNRGSTFEFTLPAPTEALFTVDELDKRRKQKESHEGVDILIPARILIAEDTRAIQFMLQRMLQPVVFEIVVVNNGQEAVDAVIKARAEGRPFDVVLMDMQMPVLNGYDATSQLRAQGFELPVIALTAGAMAGDRERCLAVGCSDYLAKPVSRTQLLAMIVNYCNDPTRKSL
ncbi:hybrid sensor histidine kinase/response regulator [Planctomicrobium piriforme]|uniref:histidine kinase n=1 Tax=Planctomicrobium piriforme TaxID=1576369 RepID=A0A1I3PGT2_9PLAN|nr:ATP-binding protein [Planctomicrobium piriforme]SFJ20216.1 hypothetical protein SAMN05421753_116137 [Planctomicrobium piriforme]